MNYYTLLGVDKNATIETIKKAFRKKLKANHPDIHGNTSQENIASSHKINHENLIDIINAYNVLSNPVRRRHYDSHRYSVDFNDDIHANEAIFERQDKKVFDYEVFLLSRKNIWEYKIKLFIYDLVFKSGERAIGIYELILKENKLSDLKKTLGYFDYFDCMFLLAEYYQNKIGIIHANKSLKLYLEIGELEKKKPYFRAFMEEVTDRVLLLIHNYKDSLDQHVLHQILNSMSNWTVSKKQVKSIAKLRSEWNVV